MTENFVGEKVNEEIKGLISNVWLVLCYTVKLVIPTFAPNFIILCQVVAEKSLTEDVHMHYIGVRDRKKDNLKEKVQ